MWVLVVVAVWCGGGGGGGGAVASGEEENTTRREQNYIYIFLYRYIHIGKRGLEKANEEQIDKLRKTVRFEQEAPNTSSSSTMHVSLEYPSQWWETRSAGARVGAEFRSC